MLTRVVIFPVQLAVVFALNIRWVSDLRPPVTAERSRAVLIRN